MSRSSIHPHIITNSGQAAGSCNTLNLGHYPSHGDHNSYNEIWLQGLIYENPSLLPVEEFEPGFEEIKAVAREIRTQAGKLDNLFVTPDGDLILVECKLWRNPESRRKVISQIIDYASAISDWDYDDLNNAINNANKTNFENALYECVKNFPEVLDEGIFVTNVMRNLRLGRHLLLIVGDGIREDAERLTGFLQQRTDRHFMLGILGLNIYEMPSSKDLLIIPDIMLKTTIIERGVITIEGGTARFNYTDKDVTVRRSETRPIRSKNLTEIKFFEALRENDIEKEKWLKSVLEKMQNLGVFWDIKKSLLPRYSPDGEIFFNFGYFRTNGDFFTHNATWPLEGYGLEHLAEEYISNISSLVKGSHIKDAGKSGLKVFVNDRVLNISDFFNKSDDFIKVTSEYIDKIDKEVHAKNSSLSN